MTQINIDPISIGSRSLKRRGAASDSHLTVAAGLVRFA
jgi:hypothetical protein